MDGEKVDKRREELLAMLKHDRSQRRERGIQVSSSDEEKDMCNVDAELQSIYGQDVVSALRKG